MPKAAPSKKKPDAKKRKNTGRPVRAAVQAVRAAALKKLEEQEAAKQQEEKILPPITDEQTSRSPRHVVVEVKDVSVDVTEEKEATKTSEAPTESVEKAPPITSADTSESAEESSETADAITAQNVAEAITTENPSEYAVVRKSVSSSRLFLAALGTGIFLGVLIFGGLLLFESYGGSLSKTFNFMPATPTPTDVPKPSPTEVAINPADYDIQVLNGTGVSGAAGAAEDLLNDAGFTQTSTGNASEYGFTDTEVAMKSDVSDAVFEKLKSALSGYTVTEVTSLPDGGEYDIVITVGTTDSSE